jgi:hypothetical protein
VPSAWARAGHIPPLDSWSREQQAAGCKLGERLARMDMTQGARSILRHLEAMQVDGYTGTDPERDAIERALAELRAGKWKAGKGNTSGLESGMITALETLLAELAPPPPSSSTTSQPAPNSRSARRRPSSRQLPHEFSS